MLFWLSAGHQKGYIACRLQDPAVVSGLSKRLEVVIKTATVVRVVVWA